MSRDRPLDSAIRALTLRTQLVATGLLVILAASCTTGEVPTASIGTSDTTVEETMRLTSPAFAEQEMIPAEYTCDGEDVSPQLDIAAIPPGTVVLVLVMDDPDAPSGTFDHWVAFDIVPTTSIPRAVGSLGTPGRNSFGSTGYGGPCPPSGTHRYVHKVYALDGVLGLPEGSTKTEVEEAMQGHVLAQATLTGLYSR